MSTEKKENIKLIGICGNINSGKDLVGNIIQYITTKNDTGFNFSITHKKEFNLLDDYNGYISRRIESDWEIIKFADKLKDIVCLILGCSREQIEDRVFKESELGEEWNVCKYGKQLFVNYDNAKNALLNDYWYIKTNNEKDILCDNYIKKYTLTPRLLLQLLGTECGRDIIHPNIWCNTTFSNFNENKKWIITDVRFDNEVKKIKDKNGIIIKINRDIIKDEKKHKSETNINSLFCDYEIDNNSTIENLIGKIENILIENQIIL